MSAEKMREDPSVWHKTSIAFMQEVFSISEDNCLHWKHRPESHFSSRRSAAVWNGRYAHKPAGCEAKNQHSLTPYIVIRLVVDGIQLAFYAHRIIWALRNGHWPDGYIDHKDGNGLNNAQENMTIVSTLGSGLNRPNQRNNKTGVPGVSIDYRGRFRVQAGFNGQSTHLGYFHDLFSAACAKKSFELANGYSRNHGRKAIESLGLKVKP